MFLASLSGQWPLGLEPAVFHSPPVRAMSCTTFIYKMFMHYGVGYAQERRSTLRVFIYMWFAEASLHRAFEI